MIDFISTVRNLAGTAFVVISFFLISYGVRKFILYIKSESKSLWKENDGIIYIIIGLMMLSTWLYFAMPILIKTIGNYLFN